MMNETETRTSSRALELIVALQAAIAKHEWPLYKKVEGKISAHCMCGAHVKTTSAWLDHLKNEVVPEAVRAALPGRFDL